MVWIWEFSSLRIRMYWIKFLYLHFVSCRHDVCGSLFLFGVHWSRSPRFFVLLLPLIWFPPSRIICCEFVNVHCSCFSLSHIWLSAKRCANWRSDFWLSIKSVSNTLSCCCFVCAFIIGQYHSGNNMSSKSGAAGELLFFENEKRHEIRPLKTDTLTVSAFNAFIHVHDKSKHYLSHRFAQRKYCFTQCI